MLLVKTGPVAQPSQTALLSLFHFKREQMFMRVEFHFHLSQMVYILCAQQYEGEFAVSVAVTVGKLGLHPVCLVAFAAKSKDYATVSQQDMFVQETGL